MGIAMPTLQNDLEGISENLELLFYDQFRISNLTLNVISVFFLECVWALQFLRILGFG